MKRAPWLYRAVVMRAFPGWFRARWGAEMEDTFNAHLAAADGAPARVGVWLTAMRDALTRGVAARTRRGGSGGHGHGPSEGGEGMRSLLMDLRFAVRSLARRPALTLAAVATLALGIGANTAIFSIVNGLLLRPLPYPEADRLVMLWAEHPEQGWSQTDVNPADAWDIRARAGVFDDLAVYDESGPVLTGGDHPELLSGLTATPNLLGVLRVSPAMGRDLGPDDARPGAPGVAILSHGFWERRFGGDPGMLGTEILLDDEAFSVVGIMGPDFRFLDEQVDVILPARVDMAAASRDSHSMEAVARLAPGVTLDAARRAVTDVARQLQSEHPDTNEGWLASLETIRSFVLGDVAGRASLVLSGAVGFLLLMACVNVANLLLSRAGSRQSEMAVRTALGAGRGRLLRLLLTESVVLAVVGGAAGLVLAEGGRRFIVASLPENLPPVFRFDLDAPVLGFALAVTLCSALVFGLLPALRTARPASDLRSGRRVRGSGRLSGALVVVQTALAVVLLVAGGVLARSVVAMQSQDFGWDPDRVLYVRVSPPEGRYPGAAALVELTRALRERVAAVPGVEASGEIHSGALQGSNWMTTVQVPDGSGGTVERPARAGYVTPGYFEAMGVDVLAGRDLTPADEAGAPRVAVVNRTFVDRYLGGGDAVGVSVPDGDESSFRIVGVVEDHMERSVEDPVGPALYRPIAQNAVRTRTLVVRAAAGVDPESLAGAVREAVWAVDGDLPVWDLRTLEDLLAMRIGGFQLIAELMAAFALVSLFLGAVGIYGVTAHAVGQRTHEIGVRMAMGADRRGVLRMVVVQGARRAALGLVLGTALALPLSGALAGIAVGVNPRDPVILGGVLGTLALVALVASWLPARKASGVDPVRALATD